MSEITTQEAFYNLKPLCDLLVKNPTKENAENVCECLKKIPKLILQNLMEYILFPSIIRLETTVTSAETSLHLLSVINSVLSEVRTMKIELFFRLYGILLRQVHDVNQPTVLISEHEELKLIVMNCLKNLFLSASSDVIESIYTRNNSLKLSKSFFLCITIAKSEKYSTLRISAIETLMTLSYIHDEADETDIVLRSQVADVVMLYFPGIVRGMLDIANGNETQNHKVTLMAIRALGRAISLIMEDLPNEEPPPTLPIPVESFMTKITPDPLGIKLNLAAEASTEQHLQTTVRNLDWLQGVSEKLLNPLKTLSNFTKHPHPKVRRELLTTVSLLLTKCTKNMCKNIPDLVDIIISLSEDNEEEIKIEAKSSLQEINKKIISNLKMRSITSLLEENFYKLLTKLPRIMRRSESAAQLSYLNQLTGYLRIFGSERLSKIMSSISHLRRLLLSLIYVIELDSHQVSILEENQIKMIEDTSHLSVKSWKKFKFIEDPVVHDKLIIICQLLGELGDVNILIDSIIELMNDIPQYKKELTLLLNWICLGSTPNLRDLYPQVINYYIEDDLWYLPIEVEDDTNLSQVQSNIVQNCLLMEGLGIIASVLREEFQQFLLKTMYLIIERAGNKNRLISAIGLYTLQEFSKSQRYSDITSFLQDNVDYISYHVTVKLRRVEKNIGVLDVVNIVVKYSTLDFLPCLKEIVTEALGQLRVNSRGSNSHSILKVLDTFVVCIRRQVCQDEEDHKEDDRRRENISNKVIEALIDYHEAKQAGKMDLSDDDDSRLGICDVEEDEDFSVNPEEDIEEEKIPSYVDLIEEVMKCSLNFVPSKKIPETLIAMEILQGGLRILAPWKNQLLPIIHQLWDPLVDRFKESNLLIMNHAWQLLYTVSKLSEEFVRSRTLDQVSPAIAKFLEISGKESYGKDLKGSYQFTQMFKLQKMILEQIGEMAEFLKFRERELWQLLCITERYLNCYQHEILQECCLSLFKTAYSCNGDVVWVKCLSLWNSCVKKGSIDVVPNIEDFNDELRREITKSPFGKNIIKLLKYINEVEK